MESSAASKTSTGFGEDKSEFEAVDSEIKNLLQGSELNQYRKENDRQEVQGLWISGGGFDTAIKDVSFTRVVQTNSVLVKGICKSCGIANNFVTPEARRGRQNVLKGIA